MMILSLQTIRVINNTVPREEMLYKRNDELNAHFIIIPESFPPMKMARTKNSRSHIKTMFEFLKKGFGQKCVVTGWAHRQWCHL